MSAQVEKCPYIFKDEFERLECDHPVYEDHGYCVFHSDRIQEKANDFYKAFAKWIVLCTKKLDVIDLRGFVVPEMKLEDIVFEKPVDFRGARFPESILIHKVVFGQGADFSDCVFGSKAMFQKSAYCDTMRFANASFEDYAEFSHEDFEAPVIFTGARFGKIADFSASTFQRNCDMRETFFASKAVFTETRFVKGGEFSDAVFDGEVDFTRVKLDQSTDFRGTQFKGDALFPKARFSELASFWMSTFGGNATFREAFFAGNVIFWMCNFTGIADFRKTSFHQRAEFKGATFHNEIMLNESRLQFLKELDATGVNMEGTILNASHFWGVSRLEQYSFQDAFLLSNNFAGKEFVDCNFTGATFDSVHTKGWKLDEDTVRKTEYIFTGYHRETEPDEYGQDRDIFKPREDSRIPAKGNFNEGPNAGFTFADVFVHWQNKYVLFEVPRMLHDAFRQYLAMFGEYGRMLFREQISAECRPEGHYLRVTLRAADDMSFDMLDARMTGFLKPVFTGNAIEHPGTADSPEIESAVFRMKRSVETLHEAIAMILESAGSEGQEAVLLGLRALTREWSLLSQETLASDQNLDAYLVEMFKTSPAGESRQAKEEPQVPEESAPPREIDMDTILEVKFTLDDLEHALLQIREAEPGLSVKVNGIQREITIICNEQDENVRGAGPQKRIAKIVERTTSLLKAQNGDSSGAFSEATAACNKIKNLISA